MTPLRRGGRPPPSHGRNDMAQTTAARRAQGATKRNPSRTGVSKSAEPAPRLWSHGQFCWNELRTRDVERAKKFYTETIGWGFDTSCTPDGHSYWIATEDGKPVAGFFQLTPEMAECVPESWMSFLAVDDVD